MGYFQISPFFGKNPKVNKAMSRRDYYKILGVAKDAKPRDIKKSYRERAKIFHPDANKGSKKSEKGSG